MTNKIKYYYEARQGFDLEKNKSIYFVSKVYDDNPLEGEVIEDCPNMKEANKLAKKLNKFKEVNND